MEIDQDIKGKVIVLDHNSKGIYILKVTKLDDYIKSDIFIRPKKEIFRKKGVFSKSYEDGTYRLATPQEIEHLNQCIDADKYIHYIPSTTQIINNYKTY